MQRNWPTHSGRRLKSEIGKGRRTGGAATGTAGAGAVPVRSGSSSAGARAGRRRVAEAAAEKVRAGRGARERLRKRLRRRQDPAQVDAGRRPTAGRSRTPVPARPSTDHQGSSSAKVPILFFILVRDTEQLWEALTELDQINAPSTSLP